MSIDKCCLQSDGALPGVSEDVARGDGEVTPWDTRDRAQDINVYFQFRLLSVAERQQHSR